MNKTVPNTRPDADPFFVVVIVVAVLSVALTDCGFEMCTA